MRARHVPRNPYGLSTRKPGPGRTSDIHDSTYRAEVISVAATGMSRRGVAAAVGKPESTLRGWIERGRAYPDVEPWASFAVQYERAERGVELACASTLSMVVGRLYRLARAGQRGDEPNATPDERELGAAAWRELGESAALRELLQVLQARFPRDWGASAHREPEADYDPQNYLDVHEMTREQLAALLSEPTEVLRLALVDAARPVYAILVAGGFDPAAPAPEGSGSEQ